MPRYAMLCKLVYGWPTTAAAMRAGIQSSRGPCWFSTKLRYSPLQPHLALVEEFQPTEACIRAKGVADKLRILLETLLTTPTDQC